ncbi:MAG TPA: hypothetical protein VF190_04390, partial [Rhodothermales bacterium]
MDGLVVDLDIRESAGKLEVKSTRSPERVPEDASATLERRMRRMLQLNVDIADFMELASASPEHAWVRSKSFGRLLCGTTLFEDIVKIIATTNTMWSQTVRMVELLVEKCGRRSSLGFTAFPEPGEIARFSPEDLKRDCRLGYRATAVHRLAAGVATGEIDLDRVSDPSQSTEGLFAAYRTLPGIGPY